MRETGLISLSAASFRRTYQKSVGHNGDDNSRTVSQSQNRRRLLLKEVPDSAPGILAQVNPRVLVELDAARQVDCTKDEKKTVEQDLANEHFGTLRLALLDRVVDDGGEDRGMDA